MADRRYVFDRVFGMDATQEAVFRDTALPLLEGVLDGYNATVFAYGVSRLSPTCSSPNIQATGCGKTHTISGTQEDPGITVRIMERLFEMIEETKEEYETHIDVTMVEIYNELIRDLLDDVFPNPKMPVGGLKLLENEKNRVTLANVTRKRPQSVQEVMDLVLLGNQRRSTSFTASNSESSRSHAVLQIQVTRSSKTHEVDLDKELVQQRASTATLSIIDLAGSERAAATKNLGARMKEGANINKSLLALSSCFSALCQAAAKGAKAAHVPYRDSKLTRMLKFSLGGNCRTVMIVCVSPSSRDIEDTHNTLVWADRAKNVKLSASRNTAGQPVSVRQYLITIDQQAQRIKLLENQVNLMTQRVKELGSSTFAGSKLEATRQEAEKWLENAKRDLLNALPVIQAGAKQRAMWDTSQMRVESLKRTLSEIERTKHGRSADEVEKEREFINLIIRQQELAFASNPAVTDAVQREASAATILHKVFKSTEERTYDGVLDKRELAAYKIKVGTQRAELDKQISIARERGYRESAQNQADAFAQVASVFHRFVSTLQDETDMLSGVAQTVSGSEDMLPSIDRLQGLGRATLAEMASIFGRASVATPRDPPPPPAVPMGEMNLTRFSPARPGSLPGPAPAAARFSHARPSTAFAPNPALQRVRNAAQPVDSPGRNNRNASPLKSALRRPHKVGLAKARTPKKSERWKDEAGKGKLDDRSIALDALVFSSPSDREGSTPKDGGGDDGSDEWEEEDSGTTRPVIAPIALPKSKLPRATNSPPAPTVNASVFGEPAAAAAPAMPAWKQNRLLLGKSSMRLSPLGEEAESSPEKTSSPNSGPSRLSRLSGLGGPSRLSRTPLSDRQDNAPAPAPVSSTTANSIFARLAEPTKSSLLKTEGVAPVTSRMGPPSRRQSSVSMARRSSTAGPYMSATKVRRSRGSMMPSDASMSTLGIDGLPMSSDAGSRSMSMTSTTMLGGGAKRVPMSMAGSSSFGRRISLLPAPLQAMPPPPVPAVSTSGPITALSSSTAGNTSGTTPLGTGGLGAPSRLGGTTSGPVAGPRASMSMASLPKLGSGLASRPSISSLRSGLPASGSTGTVGAGDTSVRGPWR